MAIIFSSLYVKALMKRSTRKFVHTRESDPSAERHLRNTRRRKVASEPGAPKQSASRESRIVSVKGLNEIAGRFREFGRSQVVPRKIFRPLHKFMQGVFLINRKVHLLIKNRSAEERTAAVGNNVAEATRRRRRIPLAGFLLV